MEHIKITGLPFDASRIGLGTWAIGGWLWGGTEESDAIKTIHAALDSGINLIDTAPVYGFGRSEELVGKALQGGRRADAISATKVGLDWGSGKILRNSTPARLRQELEDSLRRLKTDVIDIYQVHWPDASVPFEERRQERSRPFAARQRTAPSASAIFRRSRWTASGRGRRSPPSSRPTICSSVSQLAPVADVMGWTLDAAAMQEIDRILAETITDDVGPEFMAPQPSRPAEPSRQKRAS
jgi:hypothetical protein